MVAAFQEFPSLASLVESLNSPSPAKLVYLYGQEHYLIQQALVMLQTALLKPETKDFNYEVLSGKEVSAAKIIASARTLPMMSPTRLVIIKDASDLNADETAQLLEYIEKPSITTCVCFVAEKADLRLRFFSAFKKQGLLLKLDPLSDRQLPAFLKSQAKQFSLSFEEGAMENMIERVGSDLGQLHEKLKQISSYIEPRKMIQKTDIEALIPPSMTGGIFDLIDAISHQDQKKALLLLKEILAAKEPILRIFALLSRQVRLLLMTKQWCLHSPKISTTEIAQHTGTPPFVAIKLLDQTKRLSKEFLITMQENLYQTEKLLKNSRMDGELYLEQIILLLLGKID